MVFEQGLGTCCQSSGDWSKVEKAFNLPSNCRLVVAQTVGYPLENSNTGGQRPRLPFDTLFQLNSIDNPFPRSQQVIEELQADRLLQEPALPDNPEREAEIEALRDKYKLPGAGMI